MKTITDIMKDLFTSQQALEAMLEESIKRDVETPLRQAIGQLKATRTTLKKIALNSGL